MIFLSITLYYCALSDFVAATPAIARQATEVPDNPTAANFLRRAFHGSAVLGEYLFIDGGEFSQLVNGVVDLGQGSIPGEYAPYSRQNNVTLSIDLRTSWTNASLVIKTISKGSAPVFNVDEFWTHPDGKSFYLWNGELSYLTKVFEQLPDSLWKFSGDERGGGAWSEESINYTAPPSAPEHLLRPGKPGCSTTIGDTGYYVGGYVWEQSDANASPAGYFQNTITSFNFSSGIWHNELHASIGSSGTIMYATAGTVSAVGLDGRGLMVIVGGRDPGTNVSAPAQNYFGLDNVTLYDPYIDKWYAQKATGDIPAARESFCSVTVRGDNGTYEIFIYGGLNQLTWDYYGDIFVLTIPGFVWFKAPNLAPTRFFHTCELVGGNQLISVGGFDNPQSSEYNFYNDWTIADPFIQGIGIFDMTAMAWKSSYDANVASYQSPQVVKDWYSSGGQASVQWQSLELARMFVPDTPVSINPTPAATASGMSQATSNTQTDGSNDNKQATIGTASGLACTCLALIGVFIAWLQLRRTKAAKKPLLKDAPPQLSDQEAGCTELDLQPPSSHLTNESTIISVVRPEDAAGTQNSDSVPVTDTSNR